MNFQHLEYVVAIEKHGSISKAAQSLFISQPHLSKILHELEKQIKVTIFERGNDGVRLTDAGRDFIEYAKKILRDVENLNELYSDGHPNICRFKISAVPFSHIMDAFIRLTGQLEEENKLQLYYKETNNYNVIRDVYSNISEVGVVIVSESQKEALGYHLERKNIQHDLICSVDVQIILSNHHPLLKNRSKIHPDDLHDYGIVLYDTYQDFGLEGINYNIFNSTLFDLRKMKKVIYVYSRASLHNILTQTDFFTLGIKSTINQDSVYNLVSIPIEDEPFPLEKSEMWLVRLKDRPLSKVSGQFIEILKTLYGD